MGRNTVTMNCYSLTIVLAPQASQAVLCLKFLEVKDPESLTAVAMRAPNIKIGNNLVAGTTEYFYKIQNNGNSENKHLI